MHSFYRGFNEIHRTHLFWNLFPSHPNKISRHSRRLTEQLTSLFKWNKSFFSNLREGSCFEQCPDEDKQLKLWNIQRATVSHLLYLTLYHRSPMQSGLGTALLAAKRHSSCFPTFSAWNSIESHWGFASKIKGNSIYKGHNLCANRPWCELWDRNTQKGKGIYIWMIQGGIYSKWF